MQLSLHLPLVVRRLIRRVVNLPKGIPGAAMRGPQVVDHTRGHNPLQIMYRQPLLLLHTPLEIVHD